MTGFKDEYRRRVAIRDVEEAAGMLVKSITSAAKRQVDSDVVAGQQAARINALEHLLTDVKAAIGELQVENEKQAADNKLLREQLAGRFAPIHESLAKLDPTYKPPAKAKPKEGNGS